MDSIEPTSENFSKIVNAVLAFAPQNIVSDSIDYESIVNSKFGIFKHIETNISKNRKIISKIFSKQYNSVIYRLQNSTTFSNNFILQLFLFISEKHTCNFSADDLIYDCNGNSFKFCNCYMGNKSIDTIFSTIVTITQEVNKL